MIRDFGMTFCFDGFEVSLETALDRALDTVLDMVNFRQVHSMFIDSCFTEIYEVDSTTKDGNECLTGWDAAGVLYEDVNDHDGDERDDDDGPNNDY